MESGSLKGLEFILIVGVVAWFYFAQMRNLKRLKAEREAKQRSAGAESAAADAEQGSDTKTG
ncbi:MAG: hypothetical protein PVH47_08325 [Thiohalocapsa sp.]|jgi:hypothetical protein